EAIRLKPAEGLSYYNRGVAFHYKKEYEKAIGDYSAAIRLEPNCSNAHSNLAWMLATCPKAGLRDGKKAVEHAERACNLSSWNVADQLSTLAAAYAESGKFKEAVKWQQKAIALGFGEEGDRVRESNKLKLYEAGKPFREEEDTAQPSRQPRK